MNNQIRAIELLDIDNILSFLHDCSGLDLDKHQLREILLKSIKQDFNASYFATNSDGMVVGVSLCYMPGEWYLDKEISPYLSSSEWLVSGQRIAYIHTLVTSDMPLSKELLTCSMHALNQAGTLAVSIHINPLDDVSKYLHKLNFDKLGEHKDFWFFKNIKCDYCHLPACHCIAYEYIYYFKDNQLEDDEDEIITGIKL